LRQQPARAVLVVEDETIVAHDLEQLLEELGYDTCGIASSADEALARAGKKRPDIALVDVRIKGKLDGIKTAELLQERFGIPVVYLTAHADDATVERAARTRPKGYLLKPVKRSALKSALSVALYNHAAEGEQRDGPSPAAVSAAPGNLPVPSPDAVRRQLDQIYASADFDASRRSRDFLRFIVEEALAGHGDALTQASIATTVFGRKEDFDALLDPIVRIQAGRLRRSLERYYLLSGKQDPVRIELPRGTYVPAFRAFAPSAPDPAGAREAPAAPAIATPAPIVTDPWPTVAVGAFVDASTSTEHEEAAFRLKEVLMTELGRYRDARLLREEEGEPATRARFALGGRLRRADDGWVVTAHLVDRTTGEQLWSDEYRTGPGGQRWSGSLDDVARVIAARIGAEHGVIVQALWAEYHKSPSAAAGAHVAILRAYQFFFVRDVRDLGPAIEALEQVVDRQPETALAWTFLARLYQVNYAFELSDQETPLDRSVNFASQAIRLDPSSVRARSVLASALMIKGELPAARDTLEQTLRLSPDSLVYLEIVGYMMALAGEWGRGIALVRDAMARNPHHMPHAYFGLWADYLRRGSFEEAYGAALEYGDPTFFWRSLMRTCCLGHLGRRDEARSHLADLRREKPTIEDRGRILISRYIKPAPLQQVVIDGLAKAGLEIRSRPRLRS